MSRPKQWKAHGTVSRYRQGGCDDVRGGTAGVGERCPECKAAMSEYNSQRGAGMAPDERRPIGSVRSIAGHRSSNTDGPQLNSRPSQSNSQPQSFLWSAHVRSRVSRAAGGPGRSTNAQTCVPLRPPYSPNRVTGRPACVISPTRSAKSPGPGSSRRCQRPQTHPEPTEGSGALDAVKT